MPGAVAATRRPSAARVLVDVIARIPAVGRHVDAAAEGQLVVDHHDLLVVRGTRRMGAVELEMDAPARHPVENGQRRRAAPDGHQRADVPFEHMDLDLRPVLVEPAQEGAELVRTLERFLLRLEGHAGVEVPADQIDAVPGRKDRLFRGDEIVGRIHDQREAIDMLDPPAVSAWFEQGFVNRICCHGR